MTVKQLIDKLQRNFAPEQTVYVIAPDGIGMRIDCITEDPVGRTRGGAIAVGGLGPDACVLWTKR